MFRIALIFILVDMVKSCNPSVCAHKVIPKVGWRRSTDCCAETDLGDCDLGFDYVQMMTEKCDHP